MQNRGEKEEKRRTDGMNRKQQDDIFKPKDINKHIKCKWSKNLQLKGRDCQMG